MQTVLCCAVFFLSALTWWALPPKPPAFLAQSPLATPTSTVAPAKDEMLIFVRPNGDVVLYSLADQRATLLLAQAYHYGNGENPRFYPISTPLRLSPDGK